MWAAAGPSREPESRFLGMSPAQRGLGKEESNMIHAILHLSCARVPVTGAKRCTAQRAASGPVHRGGKALPLSLSTFHPLVYSCVCVCVCVCACVCVRVRVCVCVCVCDVGHTHTHTHTISTHTGADMPGGAA